MFKKITVTKYLRATDIGHENPAYSSMELEGDMDMEIADGYHTFKELYDHRIALFKALMWAHKGKAWISRVHADGSMYDGWFIAGIHTAMGDITYHLPMKEWDDLNKCRPDENGNNNTCIMTLDHAPEWDGHTSLDVIQRIKYL